MKTLIALLVMIPTTLMAWPLEVTSPSHQVPVLELYTSEGCSSCPPADAFLAQVRDTLPVDQVTPLALHVDYWNYLGWEDPYAKAEFTQRQRQLARSNQQRSLYTPEFLVNGVETRGTRTVLQHLQQSLDNPAEVQLHVTLQPVSPDSLTLQAKADWQVAAQGRSIELLVVLMQNGIQREIGEGENAGRTLQHEQVVLEWLGPFSSPSVEQTIRLPAGLQWRDSSIAVLALDAQQQTFLQSLHIPLQTVSEDS